GRSAALAGRAGDNQVTRFNCLAPMPLTTSTPARVIRRNIGSDSTPGLMSKPELDSATVWKRYLRSGPGTAVEEKLVEQYLPLVRAVVGRVAMSLPSHVSGDDLYSAGLVGLLNAVRRFNPK